MLLKKLLALLRPHLSMLNKNIKKLKPLWEMPKLKKLPLNNNTKEHSQHYKLLELNSKMLKLESFMLIKLLKPLKMLFNLLNKLEMMPKTILSKLTSIYKKLKKLYKKLLKKLPLLDKNSTLLKLNTMQLNGIGKQLLTNFILLKPENKQLIEPLLLP